MLYCLSRRGPEYDLLPWMRERSIPLMAYSPLDQGRLLGNAALRKLAGELRCTPAQLAIAWVLAQPGVVTIPKSATRERVKENLGALDITLSPEVLAELDRAFPPPKAQAVAGDALIYAGTRHSMARLLREEHDAPRSGAPSEVPALE